MTKKLKKRLIKIIIASIIFLSVLLFDKIKGIVNVFNFKNAWLVAFGIYFVIYIYVGFNVLKKAFLGIIHLQVFDENLLMTVASLAAFSLGIYEGVTKGGAVEGFDEACAVMLFYQVGEFFQDYAVGMSRKSIKSLLNIRPDYANVLRGDEYITVSPEEVNIDDIILVKPGERIPLDGIIISGASSLDTMSITGEAQPRDVIEGDNVLSGTINLISDIKIKVNKSFYDSTVSKILDLVENASNNKSNTENFVSKFAKYYTPIVIISALFLAILPPVIIGFMDSNWSFNKWIYRAISFLVVSCPCAIVISVPLSFFSGIGNASKNGILIKGSNYLEAINKIDYFVFDKTGTLTKGKFIVKDVYPRESYDDVLKYAAIADHNSSHPIAISICEAYKGDIDTSYAIKNDAGYGVLASKDNDIICCGNKKMMDKYNIKCDDNIYSNVVYVAHNNKYLGCIILEDEIKEDAPKLINYLNKSSKTMMLTGDNEVVAKEVASSLNISEYHASLLPQDKAEYVSSLIKDNKVAFIGDGINDAPVIMQSDIGIAMGRIGADAAIEAADIVLMNDDINNIITLKKISSKTMRIVWENIIFAITIKLLILVLSAFGITNMWFAVFGDVGVAVLAILNAMRVNLKK